MRPSTDKIVVFLTEYEIESLHLTCRGVKVEPRQRKAAYKAIRGMHKALVNEDVVTDGQALSLRNIVRAFYRSRGR